MTASTSSSSSNMLALTPQIMSSFKPSKAFRDRVSAGAYFTSLCFDDKGEHLITAADDGSINLYNCRKGLYNKQVFSKKYGVDHARFTHSSKAIIYASTMENDTIRYHSIHDNKYLRYFQGHKRKVTALEMSPADDTFLSGSLDDTVRLWDLRSEKSAGILEVAGVPNVAYDPSGLIFAVTLNLQSTTLLYDIRKLDAEPFGTIEIKDPTFFSQPSRVPLYTSAKFSSDGQYLLVGTSSGVHYVVHSFDYTIVCRLEGHVGLEAGEQDPDSFAGSAPSMGMSGEETSWTPDGRYVLSGSADGRIVMWDVFPPPGTSEAASRAPPGPHLTLQPMRVIEGHKHMPSRVVRFNHRYGMFVSGGKAELAFWLSDSGKTGAASEADAEA